jgi:hypothetical protein
MGCRAAGARARAGRWLVAAFVGIFGGAGARAAEVETRDFHVVVDGKHSGDAHMTILKQDDGTLVMSCDTDIAVKVLLKQYTYSYRGREVWKDGRLARFDSTCNDDGKRFAIAAVAEGNQVRLKVNNQERMVRGDVWLSSYWSQPDNKWVNQVVPVIDADTGHDMQAQVAFVGAEQRAVCGQAANVNHFRLQVTVPGVGGTVAVDLWYDGGGRLVRQEWLEDGKHRTVLELNRLRR